MSVMIMANSLCRQERKVTFAKRQWALPGWSANFSLRSCRPGGTFHVSPPIDRWGPDSPKSFRIQTSPEWTVLP